MKTLFSQCTKIHFPAVVGNVIRDISHDIVTINLDEIAEAVNLSSRERLPGFRGLEAEVLFSMYHPVVLVPNNLRNYTHAIDTVHRGMHEGYYPLRKYLCLFGNQRLAIARKNGYEAISAVFCEDVNEAIVIGKYNEGSIR